MGDLELKPYQYREDVGWNDSLTIAARIVLTEAQCVELGKLYDVIRVVRSGIDPEPREMILREIAWYKDNGEIKEEIWLFEKEEKEDLPNISINNLERLVAGQSLIIDELLNILVSNNILEGKKVNELKAKITDDSVWEKRRELNRISVDLDEFKSLEEN